ncbi:MAG TPA: alpha/beta fold hydrolase, partial [Anaerolineales bacterium]|nr:alpha/beta fold hydrolase [Anaerolineales bacterium]
VDQGIGLLDHLGIEQAAVIGNARGSAYGLWMAARYPERVTQLILLSNIVHPDFQIAENPAFWQKLEIHAGWQKFNAYFWRDHYRDWLDFFFQEACIESHKSKVIEDLTRWGLETTPEILSRTVFNPSQAPQMSAREAIEGVQCPVLIIHGDENRVFKIETSRKLAAARPDWEFVTLEACGQPILGTEAVKVNLLIKEFLNMSRPKHRAWRRAMSRSTKRALFISSPIGLGHIQRDLAIARELRHLAPDLQIEWLAQHPVTRVLEQNGETIHPMSKYLASESAHWEGSAGEHELHCFYAWREMDEILLANFMVFLDAVRETPYDLWIGDEAWEVDYYLHENPELKTAPFVFLTDFLGWTPMDRSPNSREAFLTADYNAEMIEQVKRFKRVRDRALYIGDYDDLLPERFGPNLPMIQDWARENFKAVGYVTPFDPADYSDTRAVRARLGYDPDKPLVICAVGGTTVGRHLLRKAVEAWPLIQRERPEAQCVVVAGPRIDPATLSSHEHLEVRPYVHNLYEHLAVADLGVVQGGLSTTMELAVNRRPFLYFPLKNHCEQEYHVAYRLERYRAGRRLNYTETGAEALAEAALATLGADTSRYRPHESGGAARAAKLIVELL